MLARACIAATQLRLPAAVWSHHQHVRFIRDAAAQAVVRVPVVRDDTASPKELEFKRALEAWTQCSDWKKARPGWLLNPETGRRMELDMVSPSGRVAIEYNGAHHYVFPNAYHATEREFAKQRRRDDVKRALCEARGVRLVSIRARACVEAELRELDAQLPLAVLKTLL